VTAAPIAFAPFDPGMAPAVPGHHSLSPTNYPDAPMPSKYSRRNFQNNPDACRYRNLMGMKNVSTGEEFNWILCLGCMEVLDAKCLDAGECPHCGEKFIRPEHLDSEAA